MKLHLPTADVFIPDGQPPEAALARVTHLGIGAHQDDLEFMTFHGIAGCFKNEAERFGGVTCTDGGGSSRTGKYASFTDEQMKSVRREEQREAALVGCYAAMVQLDYPSAVIKNPADTRLREDLVELLVATRPRVIYTHNPADKHDTHIAVFIAAIQAIRALPRRERPEVVHGCEVWRDLDWLGDAEKVIQDLSGHDNLAAALNGIFDSQIGGGKRYDLAVMGRRRANATFFTSHATDRCDALAFAMDLTPLAHNDSLDIVEFVTGAIERFKTDVTEKLQRQLGK